MKNTLYKEGGFVEELMANRFHPKNMKKWGDWGFPTIHDNDDDDQYYILLQLNNISEEATLIFN